MHLVNTSVNKFEMLFKSVNSFAGIIKVNSIVTIKHFTC